MTPTLTLSNERYTIALSQCSDDAALIDRLKTFLTPYFASISTAAADDIDLHLAIHDARAFSPQWIERCDQAMTIRDTTAVGFTLRVLKTAPDASGEWFAWDPSLEVGYRIHCAQRRVDFYGDANAFIHLIELVRYYGLLIEQAKGSAIMHASAVVARDTGDVLAIGGVKGAGKTTTMLDMVASGDYLYFSGDKLLLDVVDGRLRARGWPDYPHIGIGTLRSHPRLAKQLGFATLIADARVANTEKRLCVPEAMRAALDASPSGSGTLKTVILPEVSAPGTLHSAWLELAAVKTAINTPGLFEWPHQFITSTWHGLLDPRYGTLSDTVPLTLVDALQHVGWQRRAGLPAHAQHQAPPSRVPVSV